MQYTVILSMYIKCSIRVTQNYSNNSRFGQGIRCHYHKGLLKILPSFGKNNYQSFKWFSSYLEDRTQMVTPFDVLGKELKINCGVLQESVQPGLCTYLNFSFLPSSFSPSSYYLIVICA